jgi:hypothetical protein
MVSTPEARPPAANDEIFLDFSAEDFEAYFTGFESMRARLIGAPPLNSPAQKRIEGN